MRFLRYTAPLWLRRTWRGFVGPSITIALCLGVALFALAGARRTQSGVARFFSHVNTSTVLVTSVTSFDETIDARIARLPGVVASTSHFGFNTYVMVDGRPEFDLAYETHGTFDGQYFTQDRFTPTAGRMADPSKQDEVVVNEFAANRFGFHIGQRIDLGVWGVDQFAAPGFFADPPAPPDQRQVAVVGIGVFPEEVVQDDADRTARLLVTPALSERFRQYTTFGQQGLVLAPGTDTADFVRDLNSIVPPGADVEVRFIADDIASALTALRPLTLVLAGFGAVAALGGLVLSGQAVSRSLRRTRANVDAMHSLGAGRIQMAALSGVVAAVSAGFGALGAVVVATAMSPLMPMGSARRVEPEQGIDVDLTVFGLGTALVVVVTVGWAMFVAWRELSPAAQWRTAPPRRHGHVSRVIALLPTPVATGARFAVNRRPGSPARATIIGGAIAAVMLIGATTFAGSLDRLVGRPAAFGWNFDAAVVIGNGYDNFDVANLSEVLSADPNVANWTGVYFGAGTVEGVDVPLLGMDPEASIPPVLLAGRFLRDDHEIVLGRATAASLGVGLGDELVLEGGDVPRRLEVVGLAVLPTIGKTHTQFTSLGRGAVVVPTVVPGTDLDIFGERLDGLGPHAVFVDLSDQEVGLQRLRDEMFPLGRFAGIDTLGVQRPAEIVSADDIGRLPELLAMLLAVAVAGSLVVALTASVRVHRRDLAVLCSLGFTRRQTVEAVFSQASIIVGAGLVVGQPLGYLLGRWMWAGFADRLGVSAAALAPTRSAVLMFVVGLILAIGAAVRPARLAHRIDVAAVLRTT